MSPDRVVLQGWPTLPTFVPFGVSFKVGRLYLSRQVGAKDVKGRASLVLVRLSQSGIRRMYGVPTKVVLITNMLWYYDVLFFRLPDFAP